MSQILEEKLEQLTRELSETKDQLKATSEVLRIISNSPADVALALGTIAESAARLLGVTDATIMRIEGGVLRCMANHGPSPQWSMGTTRPLSRDWVTGRAVIDRATVHVADLQTADNEFPEGAVYARQFGHRTTLAIPLLREGNAIGAILIRRMEVRPFTERQTALLKTFADQAVIAIENVRLFDEVQAQKQELSEALEHKTATSEILNVISRSPTDAQPVFDAIVESAARLCEALFAVVWRYDGDLLYYTASHNFTPEVLDKILKTFPARPDRSIAAGRAILDGKIAHVADMLSDPTYAHELALAGNWRSTVAVPMLRDGKPVGVISVGKAEPVPFSEQQVQLLSTFADQAVIAIENTRLLNELRKSLQQQTATADVLKVISRSTFDLQAVLHTLVESAVRLCDADNAFLFRREGQTYHLAASHGYSEQYRQFIKDNPIAPGRGTLVGHWTPASPLSSGLGASWSRKGSRRCWPANTTRTPPGGGFSTARRKQN